jgi:hypothetical protein
MTCSGGGSGSCRMCGRRSSFAAAALPAAAAIPSSAHGSKTNEVLTVFTKRPYCRVSQSVLIRPGSLRRMCGQKHILSNLSNCPLSLVLNRMYSVHVKRCTGRTYLVVWTLLLHLLGLLLSASAVQVWLAGQLQADLLAPCSVEGTETNVSESQLQGLVLLHVALLHSMCSTIAFITLCTSSHKHMQRPTHLWQQQPLCRV